MKLQSEELLLSERTCLNSQELIWECLLQSKSEDPLRDLVISKTKVRKLTILVIVLILSKKIAQNETDQIPDGSLGMFSIERVEKTILQGDPATGIGYLQVTLKTAKIGE